MPWFAQQFPNKKTWNGTLARSMDKQWKLKLIKKERKDLVLETLRQDCENIRPVYYKENVLWPLTGKVRHVLVASPVQTGFFLHFTIQTRVVFSHFEEFNFSFSPRKVYQSYFCSEVNSISFNGVHF